MTTVTIPSHPSYEDYIRSDFWENSAFRNACRNHGIPLDTPIPEEVFRLAERAFHASCAVSDDAPELWRRVVEALQVRKEAA